MKKSEILITLNNLVCLGLSTHLFETLIHDFWYDYIKLKYDEEATICYMDADVSLYTSKQMIFIKILLKMLKLDLMLQIMN